MIRNVMILAALALLPSTAFAATPPVCATAEHRALDFWLGRWTLQDERTGVAVGASEIEPVWAGCAISEEFTANDGFTGGSLVQWNRQSKVWRLTGGGSTGAAMVFEGGLEGERIVLTTKTKAPDESPRLIRMILESLADGRVRQSSDVSTDGGASWRPRYAYLYTRLADATSRTSPQPSAPLPGR